MGRACVVARTSCAVLLIPSLDANTAQAAEEVGQGGAESVEHLGVLLLEFNDLLVFASRLRAPLVAVVHDLVVCALRDQLPGEHEEDEQATEGRRSQDGHWDADKLGHV